MKVPRLGNFIDARPAYAGSSLPDPWRSRQSALVLVANRQPSDGALGSGGNTGGCEGAVPEGMGRLEGVGEAAGDRVKSRGAK
jgi:hypothetical protein